MRCNLYNVLYYYQGSMCFGRFFRPSSGAYKTVCAALGIVMLSCCLPLVWVGWKNYVIDIGNRTRDLPACSAVPDQLRHRVPP
jgi:hypothetical protein